ncbi:hypothetical protein GGR54DRAFT_584229 [Hypoxylon sp. NC1633]|nr:hypothetical protein GGR54DRAFT_584229 [Hypoxylon sp. NC1633]
MPPIPVYTDSPIVASKPSGVTPQTSEPPSASRPAPASSSPTPTNQSSYPPAQPGAAPSLPAQPTQTFNHDGPPPPQPGAVPISSRPTGTSIPPPPKTGEKYQPPQQTEAPRSVSMPYPQQMFIPPPAAPYASQQRGTSVATGPTPAYTSNAPATLGRPENSSLAHPPGYHQNSNASELDNYQRSATQQSESEGQTEDTGGVWGAAKKWAQQTGEKLAAAENEVWKKINKEP